MKALVTVLAALYLAVHVSISPFPAPVPVLLAFAAVIAGLGWLICEAVARDGAGTVLCTRWRAP